MGMTNAYKRLSRSTDTLMLLFAQPQFLQPHHFHYSHLPFNKQVDNRSYIFTLYLYTNNTAEYLISYYILDQLFYYIGILVLQRFPVMAVYVWIIFHRQRLVVFLSIHLQIDPRTFMLTIKVLFARALIWFILSTHSRFNFLSYDTYFCDNKYIVQNILSILAVATSKIF